MEGEKSFASMHQSSVKTVNLVLKSYRSYVEN